MAGKDFNHFDKVADALPEVLSKTVRSTALACQRNIQSHIRDNNQIDTGFMLNSVYTVTSDTSNYKGGAKALPSIARPADKTTVYVGVAASYAIYQNYGTRYQPGRSFFEPGVSDTIPSFTKALEAIPRKLKEAAE